MNQGHQASGHVNVTRRQRHWRLVIRDTGWGIQAQRSSTRAHPGARTCCTMAGR